jgi:long-chain acyl-CoA synthetase
MIRLGGCSHLITNPRDMDRFIGELKKVQLNAITGVNTLFSAMLKHPEFKKIDFSALRLTLAGGMSVQPTTAEAWHKTTGSPIVEAYGLTESSPAITANLVHIKNYTGHIGFPLPSTEVSIRNDDGMPLPVNTAGELWARGPQVMKGYWNNPDETHQVLTDDGWLKTGDIATMSEYGIIQIVDRKKDIIIISGFNAYPNEIETILTNHPDIDEAGVIGVEDENTGEAIKAVIVKHRQNLTKEEIIDHCRKYLAAYKVPKVIEFRDELPKTNVGKVLRRSLK